MDGLIIVNKPRGITSRDVVNRLTKILKTKKIGHTGTLDPIAEGVLVLCVGKATKLVDIITANDKEYIAEVKLGILTDTLDLDGNIIKKESCFLDKEKLISTLKSFNGSYEQEVPIYSAVKIDGKKLYDYARNNENVVLPKRKVEIKNVELLDYNDSYYKFKVKVSKGTYIRSLIKDINDKMNVIGVMSSLIRTKQGIFDINESYKIEDIENNNYKILSINDLFANEKIIDIDDILFEKIKNGAIIDNIYDEDKIFFKYKGNLIAIYQVYDKDNAKIKPYKMFI